MSFTMVKYKDKKMFSVLFSPNSFPSISHHQGCFRSKDKVHFLNSLKSGLIMAHLQIYIVKYIAYKESIQNNFYISMDNYKTHTHTQTNHHPNQEIEYCQHPKNPYLHFPPYIPRGKHQIITLQLKFVCLLNFINAVSI